ncbi:hypothetical protein BASA50_000445 [Batrachochytrium salamandrivorans]|uniref:C2 domain-containing protein n=1 Tax=Batrachochytrium salamandrivorans TaxID=1357716 RepID=A0ABQ8EWQ0_9FUNG|nr:hypothetical protein BASA60_008409 [Batrachochytrium salamandrivorans]KAH6586490.1 hypothetical protein BASA50_000445 [Batrachochytrium salamandrivorans]KAH9246867.1 hypothetical protein BASA81_015548 [Batrachochytrium salamandrivorans]KAH9275442.1 hypothetical protein BASA83_002216 [Batrachochytrium salamandrivorans]
MWGFGSARATTTTTAASTRKDRAASSKRPSTSNSLFDDEAIHHDYNDDELNDPALLAELAALSGGIPASSHRTDVHDAPRPTRALPPPSTTNVTTNVTTSATTSATTNVFQESVDPQHQIYMPVSHDEEVHVDFTDDDMNDPNLLAELHQIHGPSDSVSAPASGGQDLFEDKDDESHLADAISRMNMQDHSYNQSNASESVLPSSLIPTHSASTEDPTDEPLAASASEESEFSIEDRLKSTDPALLSKHIQLEKIRAVNKKRAGNKAGALDSLRNIKLLQSRLQSLSDPTTTTASALTSSDAAATDSVHMSLRDDVGSTTSTTSLSLRSDPAPSSGISLDLMRKRQIEYKQAALSAKRSNDLARAREMLMVSKKIQDAIDLFSISGSLSPAFVLPASPSSTISGSKSTSASSTTSISISSKSTHTVSTVASSTSLPLPGAGISPTLAAQSESRDIYEHILSTLKAQRDLCVSLSTGYYKSGQKALALEFHKRRIRIDADSQTVKHLRELSVPESASSTASPTTLLPFSFYYEDLKYTISQTNDDVGIDQVQVCVLRAMGLGNREVNPTDVESSVTFDFGWPQEGDATSLEGRGESPIVHKTSNPEYNFSKTICISRTKPFQRFLERRKAIFEVCHYKPGLFSYVMARKMVLGKASVKLDALLTKCEIHEVINLVDPSNPRRETGSKLEVRIKMRQPLLKPDVVTKTERWLIVDFGKPLAGGSPQNAGSSSPDTIPASESTGSHGAIGVQPPTHPATLVQPNIPSRTNSPALPPKAISVAPSKSPSTLKPIVNAASPSINSPPRPKEGGIDIDSLELDFLNPDLIASNQVLEHEHGQILSKIATLKVTKAVIPEDLQDKKTAYEIRMNLLVTLIQLGKLTMEDYLAQVKACIATSRTTAIEFKRAGKMDLAKQALTRIKLMTAEVEEVEQAI